MRATTTLPAATEARRLLSSLTSRVPSRPQRNSHGHHRREHASSSSSSSSCCWDSRRPTATTHSSSSSSSSSSSFFSLSTTATHPPFLLNDNSPGGRRRRGGGSQRHRGIIMTATTTTTNNDGTAVDVPNIITAAEAFVREELAGMDGSHDWWHIHRVRQNALSLALEENLPAVSLEVVELAALLHDVRDWKYSGDVDAGADAVREWLQKQGYPRDKTDAIVDIISRMGFKEELKSTTTTSNDVLSPEFKVVQDADRLDAIGAIGIGRTFCYVNATQRTPLRRGGASGDPMHVPGVKPREKLTKEQYMSGGGMGGGGGEKEKEGATTEPPPPPHVNTTINHFHEKLLKLKGLMKSKAGKRRAEGRHRTMLQFLEHFHAEWEGNE